jgi:putative transposase
MPRWRGCHHKRRKSVTKRERGHARVSNAHTLAAMPRQPRSLLGDGIFHVVSRGVARMVIFRDRDDYGGFVGLLGSVVDRFLWTHHAYCLMPNHFHLVVQTTRVRLSNGMHRLNGLYAEGFNDRYERVGHVFQDRFGARLIEDGSYLTAACAYVVNNPVRAGLVDTAEEWPWSSAGAHVSPGTARAQRT